MQARQKPDPECRYIEGLLSGDSKAIEGIYQNFSKAVLQFIVRNSGSPENARDLFQEALIFMLEKFRKEENSDKRPSDQQFGSYLFTVCKYKWLKKIRALSKENLTIQDLKGFSSSEEAIKLAEEHILEKERDVLFRRKFEELSPLCRELLTLSWSGNLSMKEVAGQMKKSYDAARVKKTECIARLISLIKADPAFKNLNDHQK